MDDSAFIAALQLTDSFFPSGAVTLSHGLETFLSGQSEAVDLSQLLRDYLERKIAPFDLVAYMHAYQAVAAADIERLHRIDRYLNVSLLPQELRQGSLRSGRGTLETLRRVVEEPLFQTFLAGVNAGKSNGHLPICLAILHHTMAYPPTQGRLYATLRFHGEFSERRYPLGLSRAPGDSRAAHSLPTAGDATSGAGAGQPT